MAVVNETSKARMNKTKKIIVGITVAVGLLFISGTATFALLLVVAPKNDSKNQTSESKDAQADKTNNEAQDLIDDTAKLGNTKESDKKTDEAISKFDDASKQYEQAGNKDASTQAKANADMLASRVAAEEAYKKQQAEEQAKQQAAMDAAKAAMEAGQ